MREMIADTDAGAILYDADRLSEISDDYFEADYWAEMDCLEGAASGRGSVYFISGAHGRWALRHYQRGGLVAHLVHDRYLFWGANKTRSFVEWRLLADLLRQGLPVPAPIAARYVRRGALYRADLITHRLDGAVRFSDRLLATEGEIEQLAFAVGACIRQFHDAGAYHADLNAHNIMLADDEVYLLDFDKGQMRRAPGRWSEQNLDRLRRSVQKVAGGARSQGWLDQLWRAVEHGYQG